MYLLFSGASLKIARNLIRVTGTHGTWETLRRQSTSKATPRSFWKEVLGLSVCNLAQTMLEGSADRELDPEDRQDILEDFVMEILRQEKWFPDQDGAERMELCLEVLQVAERLTPHFSRTRVAQGLKPRPEAVRDVLSALELGSEQGLLDALNRSVEEQHQRFLAYLKDLLEPLPLEEDGPAGPEVLSGEGPAPVTEPTPVPEEDRPDLLLSAPLPEEVPAGQEEPVQPEELSPIPEAIPGMEPAPSTLSVDLDALTETPWTGLPVVGESPAPSFEGSATGMEPFPQGEPAQEPLTPQVPEDPGESTETSAGTDPGPVLEPAVETVIPPSPLDLSVQPILRPRTSISRSVDPQKLAKVLEYLMSTGDMPLPPAPAAPGADAAPTGSLESPPETGTAMEGHGDIGMDAGEVEPNDGREGLPGPPSPLSGEEGSPETP